MRGIVVVFALLVLVFFLASCSFHDDKQQRALICEDIEVQIQCDAEPICTWTPQGCKPGV